jgi:hypothetical protein
VDDEADRSAACGAARHLRDERGREKRVRQRPDPARPQPRDARPQLGHVVDVDEHRAGREAAGEAGVRLGPDREHDAARRQVRGLVEDANRRMRRQPPDRGVEQEHGDQGREWRSACRYAGAPFVGRIS